MSSLNDAAQILEDAYKEIDVKKTYTENTTSKKIEFICRCVTNKALIRFVLSCVLAKIHKPDVDIRKPYTEISGKGSFSGRTYDEGYLQEFILKYKLPCNKTTAYLTPALRNNDTIITKVTFVGTPKIVYELSKEIINSIYNKEETSENVLREFLKHLIILRDENAERINALIATLDHETLALSSEDIITILTQHLLCKNSSRVPVLIIAAAYKTMADKIGEDYLPLLSHNAADKQTGSLGDVEVILVREDKKVATCYEMKDKLVTKNDIDLALLKIVETKNKIDNYIFITTDIIDPIVLEYAKSTYDKVGIEITILDCIGFIRHYLHFFHRHRVKYINNYQEILLEQPSSSVSQSLKEAFLALRRAAES